ncbi:family S53 protease [Polyporus arcularius HHB13444]|uniref:tripeptidyl-peptidase II n=1 Tax=Polyporus arcularius HHB13444 TaxID=1314778 RepID=A0A5C3PIJ5_9APHY|nr:family S53 protease [Polyporus arcularius HHB13444]
MLTIALFILVVLQASNYVFSLPYENLRLHRLLSPLPAGYAPHDTAPQPDQELRLTIAVPQVNESGLYVALLDVSDPASKNYGLHLSAAELGQYTAPRPESLQVVTQWLHASGIAFTPATHSGDMLQIRLPLERANTLLDANFTTYIHEPTNTTTIRTLSYALPAHLHEHITLIYPTTQFVPPTRSHRSPMIELVARETGPPATCAQAITPACLQKMYNIPTEPATAQKNSLYVSGFGQEVANIDDLKGYLSKFRTDIKNPNFQVLSTDGASSNGGQGTFEANSDSQITVGLATNVPITYLKTDKDADGVTTDDLLNEMHFLLTQDQLPSVITTSYVFQETEDLASFAQTLCNAYARLGAMGTSVIFAAGDCGVAGGFLQTPADCVDKPFVPTFPSTCPYVTSVGATQGLEPEVAWTSSSGGFSNIFQRPSYQDAAVEEYLLGLGSTYTGRYNASGRAFPDVSAHGVNYLINYAGTYESAFGTSMAAPTFASIIALLDDRLLTAGKPKLGFLNPLLYSSASAAVFTDMTSGSNPGCGTDGFPTDVGWDPVTGLGTPDYSELLEVVTGGVVQSSQNTENYACRNHIIGYIEIVVWTSIVVLCNNLIIS